MAWLAGPRHRTVATLGKLPGLDEEARVGWEHIGEILDGRGHQLGLLRREPSPPQWARVDTSRMRVERLRKFGEVYLGLALWRRLKLDAFLDEAMTPGREDISWGTMACILSLAWFCAPSSELQIAEFWYAKTALDELLGVAADKVNDDRLYRALDELLPHKDGLFRHFQRAYGELFGATFDILLYDITSTYFEGQATGNAQAKYGYSRDRRFDCAQVCIALVVTPKSELKAFERHLAEQDWEQVAPGVDVKLCAAPDGSAETFVLCRSEGRTQKEHAIRDKQVKRIEAQLNALKEHIEAPQRALRNRSAEQDDPGHPSRKRLTIAIGKKGELHERTQAHILVCFLALVMWRTLQQWMVECGLGTAPRKLLEHMAQIHSLDVILPTGTGPEVRLRTVSRPDTHLAILLERPNLPLPTKPKSIKM